MPLLLFDLITLTEVTYPEELGAAGLSLRLFVQRKMSSFSMDSSKERCNGGCASDSMSCEWSILCLLFCAYAGSGGEEDGCSPSTHLL